MPTRYLPGKYELFVQENRLRYTQKRPSELQITSLVLPFDMNKFNFTKIHKNEILFRMVKRETNLKEDLPTITNVTNKEDLVIINNSPIEYGHVLILPDINQHSNQVLTKYAINLALDVCYLTSSNEILIGFNSLNAYASVNHMHLQLYYLDHNKVLKQRLIDNPGLRSMSIQNLKTADRLAKNLWFASDHFFPAFVLQLCDFKERCDFVDKLFSITNYLTQNEIAHNVDIVKANPFTNSDNFKSIESDTVRAFIFARVSSQELPDYNLNERKIGFAMCEFAGHFMVQSNEDFDELTEDWVIRAVEIVKLSEQKMSKIKHDLIKMFDE